jgi:nitrogen-specific signal transduction histidine kinase
VEVEEIMTERYTEPSPVGAESTYSTEAVRELLGRLLPGADGILLLAALQAEHGDDSKDVVVDLDREAAPAARELARVRRLFLAGEGANAVHHAMSNTLTALQTEAQLLELEPLADEHRSASTRIVELTRRLTTVMRRLDVPSSPSRAR